MTQKNFKRIDSKGHEELWEWDETPELKAFIKSQTTSKIVTPPLYDPPKVCYNCQVIKARQ